VSTVVVGRWCCSLLVFFFASRGRHTSSTRDWSSDVCSSDLAAPPAAPTRRWPALAGRRRGWRGRAALPAAGPLLLPQVERRRRQIGRASCRERGYVPRGTSGV